MKWQKKNNTTYNYIHINEIIKVEFQLFNLVDHWYFGYLNKADVFIELFKYKNYTEQEVLTQSEKDFWSCLFFYDKNDDTFYPEIALHKI